MMPVQHFSSNKGRKAFSLFLKISCYTISMSKKINIKKFLSTITENAILEKLFNSVSATDVPFIAENAAQKDREKVLFAYYKSLEADIRIALLEKINLISVISDKNGARIIKSILDKSKYEPLDVVADSNTDKAVAFYFEHNDQFEDVYLLCNILTKSGFKRFESAGKEVFDLEGKDNEFQSAIMEHIAKTSESRSGSVRTVCFDKNYYTQFLFEDAPELDRNIDPTTNKATAIAKRKMKEMYFVYLPESKTLLTKTIGNFEEQYFFFFFYSRIYVDFNLSPKEYQYDLSRFVGADDHNYPLVSNPDIISWKILSVSLERSVTKELVTVTCNPKIEGEGMQAFQALADTFNLKDIGFEFTKVKLQMIVRDENSKKGESKVVVGLTKNKSTLNLLRREHLIADKILFACEVGLGYKEVEMKHKSEE